MRANDAAVVTEGEAGRGPPPSERRAVVRQVICLKCRGFM